MAYQKTEHDRKRNAERKKEWYAENREEQQARIKANKQKNIKKLVEYKKGLACQICGEDHPAALDFHHRNSSDKTDTILALIRKRGWGWERVLTEIAKCDVLCSNCHRKLHYEERLGSVSPLSDKESKG